MNTSAPQDSLKQLALKELALFTGLLFLGIVVLPLAVFGVGQVVFGAYGGVGYGDFFSTLSGKVARFDLVAWFLILSPYLGLQCLRLAIIGWRLTAQNS
ncbi:MAG: hypothetical protein K0U72_05050 [Gammaproteobacteria bacterium]|nr:hypothetical protein [Gammaproteobacteria bacterium]